MYGNIHGLNRKEGGWNENRKGRNKVGNGEKRSLRTGNRIVKWKQTEGTWGESWILSLLRSTWFYSTANFMNTHTLSVLPFYFLIPPSLFISILTRRRQNFRSLEFLICVFLLLLEKLIQLPRSRLTQHSFRLFVALSRSALRIGEGGRDQKEDGTWIENKESDDIRTLNQNKERKESILRVNVIESGIEFGNREWGIEKYWMKE